TAAGLSLGDALEAVRTSSVFTTHTPVPAGNEVFDPPLVKRYLAGLVAAVGLEWDDFLTLGRDGSGDAAFGLTPLALRVAGRANGGGLDDGDDALTIGFARRFATYKRAGLLFSDPDRLARLVESNERPVRIILAGKAHPADEGGKRLIREIWQLAHDPRFAGR